MARTKIDYGIDLGTTNSAIARMENGEPTIKKTDTQMDTMPSCVSFNKKQIIQVGLMAYNALRRDKLSALKDFKIESSNTFIEFKRTMGTDKRYSSAYMDYSYTSEDLSAEVLKKLKSFVTDEDTKSIVITVPAKFTINQKDATSRAAKLAGFEHCELLQEPIAASMAYGLDSKNKDGLWLVFDFGGGTFDAALVKVEDGIMKVIDTEGDNYLGGKNIDYAIVDEIILPYLQNNYAIDSILNDDTKRDVLRDAMKYYAEETKIQLSFNESHNILSDLGDIPGTDDEGQELELDITVDQEMLENTVRPIFQKAIDICNDLLIRNHFSGKQMGALILVGGPTYSPILRRMLKEKVAATVDTTIDPMTAVAKGAALYASTISVANEILEKSRDKTRIQLGIGYEPTTVESEELVTLKILREKTSGKIPNKVFAEIVRADKAWSSGRIEIGEAGEVIETKLNAGKANSFAVFVYTDTGDPLPCEPDEFTIIQGSKIGSATLPYSIGIEIKNRATGKVIVVGVKGLEKNQSLPATGTSNSLKTQKDLRPGMREDFIKIPVYEAEHGAIGSRAIYNQHVFNAVITGEDLPKLLPAGSDVDLTIKFKDSTVSLSAYFPLLEYTHEVTYQPRNEGEIDSGWLETEIEKAKQSINIIRNGTSHKQELDKLNSEVIELDKLLEQSRSDYDRKKQVLDNLRRTLRKLEDIQEETEFPKTQEELKETFYRLEDTLKKVEDKVDEINITAIRDSIAQFKIQIPQVIKDKNVNAAKELIDQMRSLDFALVDAAMGAQMDIQILKEFNEDFNINEWSDKNKARILINQGLSIASNNPSKQRLRPIVIELYKLLPKADKPLFANDDTVLTD